LSKWINAYKIILTFAIAKLAVHLLTATNYGLQRDAYLYLAQSRNLDWGYFSTPPLVAFITRVHTLIWGDSLLAVRLLPALTGAVSIFIVGWLIRQLKGGTVAQLVRSHGLFYLTGFSAPCPSPATCDIQSSFLVASRGGDLPNGAETGSPATFVDDPRIGTGMAG